MLQFIHGKRHNERFQQLKTKINKTNFKNPNNIPELCKKNVFLTRQFRVAYIPAIEFTTVSVGDTVRSAVWDIFLSSNAGTDFVSGVNHQEACEKHCIIEDK